MSSFGNKIKISSPEDDPENNFFFRSGLPTSPTDTLMSPCTRVIERRKNKKKKRIRPIFFDKKYQKNKNENENENKNDENENLNLNLNNNTEEVMSDVVGQLSDWVKPCDAPTQLDIILGSTSYTRGLVMDTLGWNYSKMSPDIDEQAIRVDNPYELPVLIARAKNTEVLRQLSQSNDNGPKVIITADQVVLHNNEIREKPINEQQAREFLQSYSNSSVSTVSGVTVTNTAKFMTLEGYSVSTIYFDEIPQSAIDSVINGGWAYSAAGALVIEDEELRKYVKEIDGGLDGIFGLPVELLINLIQDLENDISLNDNSNNDNK